MFLLEFIPLNQPSFELARFLPTGPIAWFPCSLEPGINSLLLSRPCPRFKHSKPESTLSTSRKISTTWIHHLARAFHYNWSCAPYASYLDFTHPGQCNHMGLRSELTFQPLLAVGTGPWLCLAPVLLCFYTAIYYTCGFIISERRGGKYEKANSQSVPSQE